MTKKTTRKKKNSMNKKKRISSFFLLLFIIFCIVFSISLTTDYFGGGKNGDSPITFCVKSGDTTKQISDLLKEKDVIKYPLFFRVMSKISGYDGKYKEGIFYLEENMGYNTLFKKLSGPPDSTESVKIMIPEGYEFRQIADAVAESGIVSREEFCNVAENGNFDYEFLKDIPKRENRLEGYLFPDTYLFDTKSNAESIINTMLSRFDEVFTKEYEKRAQKLDMTVDEIVTLASIIEREAQGDVDRDNVASVFHNRLKSEEYPYLQSCATVQYVLKERKPVLSTQDTKIDSPYNTYKNPGLPVGPIASPGAEAIKSALYPADTDYLFFVLDSGGTHRFAKTYEEHLENSRK